MRFVKTENELNKTDNWIPGYSNQNGYEDDEEEEEIDVVNVHSSVNNPAAIQNLNFNQQSYLPSTNANVSSNTKANNSSSNAKYTKNKKNMKNSNINSDSNNSGKFNLKF